MQYELNITEKIIVGEHMHKKGDFSLLSENYELILNKFNSSVQKYKDLGYVIVYISKDNIKLKSAIMGLKERSVTLHIEPF